jgi:hypothetical protein
MPHNANHRADHRWLAFLFSAPEIMRSVQSR